VPGGIVGVVSDAAIVAAYFASMGLLVVAALLGWWVTRVVGDRRRRRARWVGVSMTVLAILGGIGAMRVRSYYLARTDPARCTPQPGEVAKVAPGAIGEPDACYYYDADGRPVDRDGDGGPAGPMP
jgi:hypothetical protein